MLNLLDQLLRNILMTGVDQLRPVIPGRPSAPVNEQQVSFAPPDDSWRAAVSDRNVLNVYLVDLRENRKLRSNERERRFENGVAYDDPAPARLDCHYLISAGSPTAQLTPQLEPMLDEHILLYQAAAVLMNNAPFNPSRVYPANSTPLNAWPQRFRDTDLPAVIAPTEGFPKLAEFWSTMGTGYRWKPVLYLIVTVPVELLTEVAGPMVTTRITEYRKVGTQGPGDIWIQIGGTVLSHGAPVSIAVGGAGVLPPSQTTFRLMSTTGLEVGEMALLRGSDANHPGNPLEERVVIDDLNTATGFVTLRSTPARTGSYDLNVPPAQPPVLVPLLPVSRAWVALETTNNEILDTTETNELGRFTFGNLRAGRYKLRVRAVGLGELAPPRTIEVPSPTGEYDLQFP